MISSMIKFGKWLSENNQDDFGKITKDADYILPVTYNGNKFYLRKVSKKEDFNFDNYFEVSQFNIDFLISTDQRFMIPSKSNLLGLSPFFIKLDHDFLKKGELDPEKLEKFQNKIKRSINANSNHKEFTGVLSTIFSDWNYFLESCPLDTSQKKEFTNFFENYTFEDISELIISYYNFILDNFDLIYSSIINLKKSEEYDKKLKSNFYLACYFNDNRDLINDLFIFYSKIFKKRDEKINDFDEGICAFCGNKTITYSSLGSFVLDNSYGFNYNSNMSNSRLRLCKSCNSYLRVAENKLKQVLPMPMMIVPKSKSGLVFESFLKITNLKFGSFSKINTFFKESSEDVSYDLFFYTEGKGNTYVINKYIENYQSYKINFNNNIKLYDDNSFNYLFNDYYNKKDKIYINNLFDLENIFKSFFIKFSEESIVYPSLYNFYNIYTKDLTGKTGIFNGFDSATVSIFAKYMHNIFSLIYELNIDSLTINMLNEMVTNVLIKVQRNSLDGTYRLFILRTLNHYYMIKKEFLGDEMLNKDNVLKLKEIFSKYNKDNKDNISKEDVNKIFEFIEEDVSLKYYLLGQFVALLDNSKRANSKNGEIFSNFILNCNKNNIRKLFSTEVLQKNNFYLENMGKKGKFIFKILEQNLSVIFDEDDLVFEDYLLLLFTGYYTENILSSSYGVNKE